MDLLLCGSCFCPRWPSLGQCFEIRYEQLVRMGTQTQAWVWV